MSPWECCESCNGARIHGHRCLVHLTDDEWDLMVEASLAGTRLDARGVTITGDLLSCLRTALGASRPHDGPQFPSVTFEGATFRGLADFRGARFGGPTEFRETTFLNEAFFGGAHFEDDAVFSKAKFRGFAGFRYVEFFAPAEFRAAEFSSEASFISARFAADASFRDAQFFGDKNWVGNGPAGPDRPAADFTAATFCVVAGFGQTQFHRDANFSEANFVSRVTLGPMVAASDLRFDYVTFEKDVHVEASAFTATFFGAHFQGAAQLDLRWAEVMLDGSTFAVRSRVSGAEPFPGLDDAEPFPGLDDAEPFPGLDDALAQRCRLERRLDAQPRPRLLSVCDASIENLTLANLDLQACRFLGARGLDDLRIEADCEFAQPPKRWRYSRRLTLAEEHEWRSSPHIRATSTHPTSSPTGPDIAERDWYPAKCRPVTSMKAPVRLALGPQLQRPAKVLHPPQLASLYRALRKGLEDGKDAPGAADFYYGEMEMRRQRPQRDTIESGHRTLAAERAIIWLYWLLSGYALRASRAIAALLIVVAVSTTAFDLYGFRDRVRPFAARVDIRPAAPAAAAIGFPPSPREVVDGWGSVEAWSYSAGTATAIIGAPEAQLTQTGRAMRITLRIMGPLLIGLALLSVRGRVKR